MSKRKRIRTTQTQRTALKLLRKELGQACFMIFEVADWYKQHREDFIAVYIYNINVILLVRPSRKGLITIRPYSSDNSFNTAQGVLPIIKKLTSAKAPIKYFNRKLPLVRSTDEPWRVYVKKSNVEEMCILTPHIAREVA